MIHKGFYILLFSFVASGLAGAEEELTDIELMELFENQRDIVRSLQEGKRTRGLTRSIEKVTADNVDAPITVISVSPADVGAAVAPSEPATALGREQDADPSTTGGPKPLVATTKTDTPPSKIEHFVFDDPVNLRVVFDHDSATLTDDQTPKLVQMCRVMKATDIALYRVVGHTDSTGSELYNESLSLRRANSVKRFLVEDCGIPADKLDVIGFGERFPYDAGNPEDGLNRRVEFQALS